MNKISTTVDYLCICPIVQQVVGPMAAFYHLVNLVSNIVTRVSSPERWNAGQNHIERKIKNLKNAKFKVPAERLPKKIALVEYERPSIASDISRLGTSIIQSLPVIGTVFSLYKYNTSQIYLSIIPQIGCG